MLSSRLDMLLENIEEAKRRLTMPAGQKSKINRALYDFTTPKHQQRYFDGVPIPEIWKLLKKHDVVVVDEDGTKWTGFITGRKGRTAFDLAPDGTADQKGIYPETYTNTTLVLTWYKMDRSGRYEIVAYLS